MKYIIKTLHHFLVIIITGLLGTSAVSGQRLLLKTGDNNYTRFTETASRTDAEVHSQNKGFETHPELGVLFPNAPCDDCFELLGQRTATTKTFVKNGTGGSHLWIQSSSDPLHFKSENGHWETIQTHLRPAPETAGVYRSIAAPVPVSIHTDEGYVAIGSPGSVFRFNRRLELLFIPPDGKIQSLGQADWSRHTAGDEGVYVTDVWPGMDMELFTGRGFIKTAFRINKPMPMYTSGQFVIRDWPDTDAALELRKADTTEWYRSFSVHHVLSGEKILDIGRVVAYANSDKQKETTVLEYRLGDKGPMDMIIPGSMLGLPASSYPVIVDPLVQATNAVTIAGSGYDVFCDPASVSCIYTNPVPVPAGIVVTDLRFSFTFLADNGAAVSDGTYDIVVGSCRSPSQTGYIWTCAGTGPGDCAATNVSVFPDIRNCIPPPQCAAYNLDVALRFARCYGAASGCQNTYISAASPFTVTIEGRTVESGAVSVGATAATICAGDSTTLTVSGAFGVPPYTYTWDPGALGGQTVTVKPAVTTNYTVTVRDQCGNTIPAAATVTVVPDDNPGFSVTPDPVCAGDPVTVSGNGNAPPGDYSWTAPGSHHPTQHNTQHWTTTYDTGGVYPVTLLYRSGNCIFPLTREISVVTPVEEIRNDTICEGEIYMLDNWTLVASGTYTRVFPGTGSCDSTVTVHLVVHPLPADPVAGSNSPVCVGDTVQLNAVSSGGVSYSWTGPDGYLATGINPVIPMASMNHAGIYTVTATARGCTSATSEINVEIIPLPEAAIRSDVPGVICAGDTISLTGEGIPALEYRWITAGQADVYGKDVQIPFIHTGHVRLEAKDTFRCVTRDSLYIETQPCCDVFFPNAFSPNGDGRNDQFRPVAARNFRLMDFRVLNRWGQIVYQTLDYTKGWDGTFNGAEQEMGVYYYYIRYECVDGSDREKKGEVLLIR